jgi:ribosomal 50S subunit-associated protein YjgA (DUF615 family)
MPVDEVILLATEAQKREDAPTTAQVLEFLRYRYKEWSAQRDRSEQERRRLGDYVVGLMRDHGLTQAELSPIHKVTIVEPSDSVTYSNSAILAYVAKYRKAIITDFYTALRELPSQLYGSDDDPESREAERIEAWLKTVGKKTMSCDELYESVLAFTEEIAEEFNRLRNGIKVLANVMYADHRWKMLDELISIGTVSLAEDKSAYPLFSERKARS